MASSDLPFRNTHTRYHTEKGVGHLGQWGENRKRKLKEEEGRPIRADNIVKARSSHG